MRVQGGARIIIAARQSPPTGAPEPHHKQNDSFAPIRVKGRCPLRVQGRARIIIAARQSPPSGANRTQQNKTSVLRFLLPTGTPPSGAPPKKAAVLAPAAPSTHPCPVRSSPQSRAGTNSLLPTRLQPGAPTGKNEKRGRIKRPQRKGVTDNKKSFRGNRERIRKHREKTQPTGSTEKSRAEPSRNQSGT